LGELTSPPPRPAISSGSAVHSATSWPGWAPTVWDKVYTGLPPAAVTAVAVPQNRFTLEGHELVIVEVGSTDSDDTTVLHVPDLEQGRGAQAAPHRRRAPEPGALSTRGCDMTVVGGSGKPSPRRRDKISALPRGRGHAV
jgi:hypothetical protein